MHTRGWIPHRHRQRIWTMPWPIILMIWRNLQLGNCFLNLFLSFAFVAPLAWTSSFQAWILPLGTHAKTFPFCFSALSFCNFFSCHFGKPIEHISFISVLDSGKSFLILGILTFFCSDLAPRISIDDFPTSLPSIARFFSNVIGFSIVEFRYEFFSFWPSYFTR